jgi:hypothetical protein
MVAKQIYGSVKKQPPERWLVEWFGYAVPEYECSYVMCLGVTLYDVNIKVCIDYQFFSAVKLLSKTKKPSGFGGLLA